jgi:hypothetical protein
MKATKLLSRLCVMAAGCLCWLSVCPAPATAQKQGQNTVCTSSTGCSTTEGTAAFIDATQFLSSSNSDFCKVLYFVLNPTNNILPTVIDARGLNSNNTNLTCSSGWTPWNNGATYLNVPSIILLPANVILTSVPWVLPNNTKLIGTAKGNSGSYNLETTIRASNSFSGAAVIEFGDSHCPSSGCQGISVEHLTVNGGGGNSPTPIVTSGIQNGNCGLLCYAEHVTLYEVLATGLFIDGANATDSGPYSDITFDTGDSTPSFSTTCAQIIQTSGTRGIHGLTCIASPIAGYGVLLDAPNNSLEDVRIQGFYDGITVGTLGPDEGANSNILFNVYGNTTGGSYPINLIVINSTQALSIMAVSNGGGGTTIEDTITSTNVSDNYVSMYVIGSSGSNGYTRFTTSTGINQNDATWMFGSGVPVPSSSTCTMGSLYSDNSGGHLYVCIPSGGNYVWKELI